MELDDVGAALAQKQRIPAWWPSSYDGRKLEMTLALSRKDGESASRLARGLLLLDRPSDALTVLFSLRRRTPGREDVSVALVQALVQAGRAREARREIDSLSSDYQKSGMRPLGFPKLGDFINAAVREFLVRRKVQEKLRTMTTAASDARYRKAVGSVTRDFGAVDTEGFGTGY